MWGCSPPRHMVPCPHPTPNTLSTCSDRGALGLLQHSTLPNILSIINEAKSSGKGYLPPGETGWVQSIGTQRHDDHFSPTAVLALAIFQGNVIISGRSTALQGACQGRCLDTAWPGPDPQRFPVEEMPPARPWCALFRFGLWQGWARAGQSICGAVLVPGREAELAQMGLKVQ